MAQRKVRIQDVLKSLIKRGESLTVEFKRAAIRPQAFATTLVAMANGDGGAILVGVENNGTISGTESHMRNIESLKRANRVQCRPQDLPLPMMWRIIKDVDGHSVMVVRVDPGETVYHTQDMVAYIRAFDSQGKPCDKPLSPEESASLLLSRRQIGFETRVVARATLTDIDRKRTNEYVAQRGTGEGWRRLFLREGFLDERLGSIAPTNAGVLLFGKYPQRFLDRCDIDYIRYEGTEAKVGRELNIIKRQSFEGPLPLIIERCFDFLRTQIRERTPLTGLTFESAPEYPELAWQEAIVNGVAHRDYSLSGMPIFVRQFDNRLEVESPGRVVPPNTLDGIRTGHYSHYARNPRIVRVLYEFGFMRRLAEGLKRMQQEMERWDLSPPEFSEPNESFQVTLYNMPIFDLETQAWVGQFDSYRLNSRQRRGLAYLHQYGVLDNADYRGVNHDLSREIALRDLREMARAGIIEMHGKAGGAHYLLSQDLTKRIQLRSPVTKEERLTQYLRRHGSISNKEYCQLFNVKRNVAYKELKSFIASGLLSRVGARRGTYYVLRS